MWVLGNGPSLLDADLSEADSAHCIGVNRTLRDVEEDRIHIIPEFLLLVDYEVWTQEEERISRYGCDIMTMPTSVKTWAMMNRPIVTNTVIEFDCDPGQGRDFLTGPLLKGYLVGYYAAEVAARMVYPGGTVVLCGMDLGWPEDGPTHSFGDGIEFGCHPSRFAEAIEAFVCLRKGLEGKVEFVVDGYSALLARGFSSVRS